MLRTQKDQPSVEMAVSLVSFLSWFSLASFASLAVIRFFGSVEIARVDVQMADQRGIVREMLRDQMSDLAFPFQNSFHAEQAGGQQRAALLLRNASPHHHVDLAGLVLEGDENDAARGAGPLPAGDQAGDTHWRVRRYVLQLF